MGLWARRNERRRTARTRAGATAGALGAAIVVLGGCHRPEPAEPASPSTSSSALTPPAAVGRADLLAALSDAASAYAAGREPSENLKGRTMSLRLPFACFGPSSPDATPRDGLAQAVWRRQGEALVLKLTPADWLASPLIGEGRTRWEAAEGLWIERPWMYDAACPAIRVANIPAPAPTPSDSPSSDETAASSAFESFTAGLVVVRDVGASRLGRRSGQPYEVVIRRQDDRPILPEPEGYRLVLEGRFEIFPDGRAIRCSGQDPDRRPLCIAAVRLDVVAFETAAGERLSEWRPTGS